MKTNYLIISLLISLLTICNVSGQSAALPFEWVNVYDNGSDFGSVTGVTTDASGNTYLAGHFYGTIDFDLGAGTASKSSSGGSNDIFVQKLDANGNHQWVYTAGSTGDDRAVDVVVDPSGFVFVTGYFQGTVDFDGSILNSNTVSEGNDDVFLVKLQSAGNYVRVYSGGGAGEDNPTSMTVDDSGNIYIAGNTEGGSFDPEASTEIGNAGGKDAFYMKFNSFPTFQWAYALGSTGDDSANDVAIYNNSSLFIGGEFEGTVDFNASAVAAANRTSTGGKDAYVLRVSASNSAYGDLTTFGGTSDDIATGVAFNDDGAYVTGSFGGTVDFDTGAGTANETTVGASDDFYLLALDGALDYRWVETIGFYTTGVFSVIDGSSKVATDGDLVYLVGNLEPFENSITRIFNTEGVQLYSNGFERNQLINDIHLAGNNLYLGGFKFSTVQFDDCDDLASHSSSNTLSRSKAYVAKYRIEESATITTLTSDATIDEGQSIELSLTGDLNSADNWQWYSEACGVSGSPIGTGTSVTVNPTVTTTYFVRGESYDCITTGCSSVTVTVIPDLSDENDITSFTFDGIVGSAVIDTDNHTVTATATATTPSRIESTITVSENANGFFSSNPQFYQNGVPFEYRVRSESNQLQVWDIIINWQGLDGIYSVGPTGTFEKLTDAMSQTGLAGYDGDVIFEVEGGYDVTETVQLFNASSSHLTIRPKSGATNINFYQGAASAIFRLSTAGAANIIIDGADPITGDKVMTLNLLDEFDRGVYFLSQVSDLEFKNLKFKLNGGIGVFSNSGTTPLSNILIEGCEFEAVNSTGDLDVRGIFLQRSNLSGIKVIGNKFYNATGTPDPASYSSIIGFDDLDEVINNSISIRGATTTGISRGALTYNNSVHIYGTGSETSSSHTAISRGSAQNNIINIERTSGSGTIKRAYGFQDVQASGFDNNNIYIIDDGVSTVEYAQNATTKEAFEAIVPSTTFDQPTFTNVANADLSLKGASLSNPTLRATPLAEVTDDIEGAVRSSTSVSKGAYESPNNIADITSFSFSNQVGESVIDSENHTVSAFIDPSLGDLSNLEPTITTYPGSDINPTSGAPQNFSSPVGYTVTAEASNTQQWMVTIRETNVAPTGVALDNTSVAENSEVGSVVGTLTTTDPNAVDTHSYDLVTGTGDTDNDLFDIDGDELITLASFNFEAQSVYTVRIQTTDSEGEVFTDAFTINITDISESPTNISLDVSSIVENNEIDDIIGTFSTTDQDAAETYTYSLVMNGSLPVPGNNSFYIDEDKLRASESFDFESQDSYTIFVRTNDGNGGIFNRSMTITIANAFENPTDITLSESTLTENNSVNEVIGTMTSTDQDVGETYTYSLVEGADDNDVFNVLGNQLRASQGFDFETQASYAIRLQTTDNNGGSFQKDFMIQVTDQNEAPTNILLDNSTIQETLSVRTLVGNLSSVDPDADEDFTYSLVAGDGGDDNDSFEIDGDQLVSDEVFDYETRSTYTVRIQTSDGELTTSKAFEITITDVGPTITDIALTTNNLDENVVAGASLGTFSTLGEEVTGTYTYTFVDGQNSNASFNIINDDELVTTASFDHEENASEIVEIMTDDGEGNTFTKQIAITINDVNEAPTLVDLDENEYDEGQTIGTAFAFYVNDEDEGDSHTFTFVTGEGDDDNDKFDIDDQNLISLEIFDFESQAEYSLRVRATDAGGLFVDYPFQLFVNDVNEAPTFADQTFEIAENSSDGTPIGQIEAEDPEDGILTFSDLSGEIGAVFQISSDGQLTVESGSFLNFEESDFFEFEAEVTDGEFVETATIRVNILNVNEAPTLLELSNNTIDESTPTGTVIGLLSTTDIDAGDSHTYSITDECISCGPNGTGNFIIVNNELRSNGVFDYEDENSFTIEITSTDAGGLTVAESFIIDINNLPAQITSIELDNSSIDENEDSGSTVGTFSTFGEDLSGSYTYTLVAGTGDDDNTSFDVSGDQLVTTEGFDFESKSSYSIRVMSDDGSLTREEMFTIMVSNVNETPVADGSFSDQLVEEGFGTATVSYEGVFSDPDGDNLDISISSSSEGVVTAEVIAGNQIRITEVGTGTSTITLTADDGNGGSVSESFSFTVTEAPLGLTNVEVKIYPNPSSDFIHVESNESVSATLIDLNGKRLLTKSGSQLEMNIQSLKSGVYILQLTNGSSSVQHRIIKAN